MERRRFLQNFLITTGGLGVVASESSVIENLFTTELGESISVKEAEKWFNKAIIEPKIKSRIFSVNEKNSVERLTGQKLRS